MPKKVKKAKTKGKKGKKSKGPKINTDDVVKQAIANACLWENRLETVEVAKNEYRDNTRTLLRENERLQTQVSQTEKDTVDVISFLRDEDIKKNNQINKLQLMIKELKKEYKKEKQDLITDYTTQIETLQLTLSDKVNEVKLMQSELKLVKEFRRKRALMQKEIDDIKDDLFMNEKGHSQALEKMERKFFDEKIRMQQEANRKISELAERAHTEAISNLDETTKSVYKENVRLNEALNYHIKAGQDLSQRKEDLEKENDNLNSEKEMNSLVVEDKVIESKKLKKLNTALQQKVSDLEKALTNIISQNDEKKNSLIEQHNEGQEENKMEIVRLQRMIELKNKEMNRVKRLAKNILDQRSDVEKFFLESLEIVKSEIIRNRSQYRRDAELAYNKRMIQAHSGRTEYPKVRTFRQLKNSTNSVFTDLQAAEQWPDGLLQDMSSVVDLSELTWEQREQVLRLLFARMNGHKVSKATTKGILPPITSSPSSMKKQSLVVNEKKIKQQFSSENHTPKPPSAASKTFLTEEEGEENTDHQYLMSASVSRVISGTEILAMT